MKSLSVLIFLFIITSLSGQTSSNCITIAKGTIKRTGCLMDKMVYYEKGDCRLYVPDSIDKKYDFIFHDFELTAQNFFDNNTMFFSCTVEGDTTYKWPNYLKNYFKKYIIIYSFKPSGKNKFTFMPDACEIRGDYFPVYEITVLPKKIRLCHLYDEI